MDITFTEEQEMLKKAAREFLQKECPKSLVRALEEDEKGYSPELWGKMAQLGWLGMVYPEKYGGAGSTLADLAVIVEEMGYAALLSPFFSTVVQCGLLILEAGTEQQKRDHLPKIAEGNMLMALAFTEPNVRFDAAAVTVKASPKGNDYVINGTKLFIHDAHVADYLIVATRTSDTGSPEEGITLFIVDAKSPGIKYTLLKTVAGDKQCEVVFNNVRVPRGNMLGALDKGWAPLRAMLQKATALKCAEMVGGAQAALEISAEYSKIRIQFGRPIGSFQAVHHHFADMLKETEASRWLTYQAAWRLSERLPATKEVSIAKAKLSQAYPFVTRMAHQICGGVGFYKDFDLEIYYRRAVASEVNFGDTDFHLDIIAKELEL